VAQQRNRRQKVAQSVFTTIRDALIAEGRLPSDFKLPDGEHAPNEIRYAPGAMDGIGIYHGGEKENDEAAARIVKLLITGNTAEIPAIVKKHRTLQLIDPILHAIRENTENLDAEHVALYAQGLAFENDDVELVKLGIGILGLFDWSDNLEMQEQLVTLGLYDEFTLYVVVAAQQWDNANEVVFRIAQNVDGWGKIHAVEWLEPESDEIRDWILRHGCDNAVMDAYLGLECANKGRLIEALRKDEIDDELFNSVCVLMDALFDEGPVAGISEYEYAEEAVRLYLQHALTHARTLKHLWHILNVPTDSYGDVKISDKRRKARDEITRRESWRTMILETLAKPSEDDFFYAVNTGSRLGMDISEQLFSAVMGDPIRHTMWIRDVYKNPENAKALTELLERTLPLDKMSTGMNDYLFAAEYWREHSALEEALIGLGEYPNLGKPLVLAGLNSPIVRERNQACHTLEEWGKALSQPISTVAPDLFEALKNIAVIEVNEDTRETMTKLIEDKR
jgi:hypothetical protein